MAFGVSDSFRVDYANARRPIPQPDPGGAADLVSANFDYLAAGPSATITIGDYVLVLDGLLFVARIGESLGLAERVAASAPDEGPTLYRDDLPDLPPEATVHSWIAADMQETRRSWSSSSTHRAIAYSSSRVAAPM